MGNMPEEKGQNSGAEARLLVVRPELLPVLGLGDGLPIPAQLCFARAHPSLSSQGHTMVVFTTRSVQRDPRREIGRPLLCPRSTLDSLLSRIRIPMASATPRRNVLATMWRGVGQSGLGPTIFGSLSVKHAYSKWRGRPDFIGLWRSCMNPLIDGRWADILWLIVHRLGGSRSEERRVGKEGR